MNKKLMILPVVLLAAGAFIGWRVLRDGADANTIRISGNIELTEVDLSFKLPGRLIELAVDECAAVHVGQLIARLDNDELSRQRQREHAGIASAESSLDQLRTSIAYQAESITGDVEFKRADLAAAEARLREMENGSRPQELETARAALAEVAAQNTQAQQDWQRAQRLYKNDDISTSQFDQFRAKADAAAASLKRAKEQMGLVQEGPRKEQIEQQRALVARGRAAVRLAEANRLELERRRKEVSMRQAEIERARAQSGVLDVQISDRLLISPVAGVVLTKSAEAGEVLAGGATVVSVGDIDHPWVRGYIAERDLGRVKLGMPADVTSDSYANRTYHGKVTFISSEAEFTPKQIQTQEERQKLVYRIKIEVENPNRELKSNMPVDAVLHLQ
jgi:HlyD family secretion protein